MLNRSIRFMVQFLSHFVVGYGEVSNKEYKTEENRTETKHKIEPQQFAYLVA